MSSMWALVRRRLFVGLDLYTGERSLFWAISADGQSGSPIQRSPFRGFQSVSPWRHQWVASIGAASRVGTRSDRPQVRRTYNGRPAPDFSSAASHAPRSDRPNRPNAPFSAFFWAIAGAASGTQGEKPARRIGPFSWMF